MGTQREISGMQRQSAGGSSNLISLPVLLPKPGVVGQRTGSTFPASWFSILPGHFGNSLKKIAAQNPVSSKKKVSFAPWSFCVLCVHPAVGGAVFSGATNSRGHQYINSSVISEGYEWVDIFATEMKKWISLICKFYFYKYHVHIRSASNFH